MGTIAFYLALPVLYGVSVLPFPLLYLLSDVMCFVTHRLLRYRRDVVMTNLRNSFPEKSEVERRAIAARFYRWLCDLTLETIKTLTISPRMLCRRMNFQAAEVFRGYARRGQSVVLVMGHFGNWELAGARYSVEKGLPQLFVIYHPLGNKGFDRLMRHMRTRLGTRLYTMAETGRAMLRDRGLLTTTAFIADQAPAPERAIWTTFLGQDTPVFAGPEAMARRLGRPVVYISVTRPRRGYYHMEAETLVEDPASLTIGAITEAHVARLERDIRRHPEFWLWTHRRWKHGRPVA